MANQTLTKSTNQLSDDNKAIVERYVDEVYNKGNLAAVDELLDPDYRSHGGFIEQSFSSLTSGSSSNNDRTPNLQALKRTIPEARNSFSDRRITVGMLVAEGDFVAFPWIAKGKQTGELLGVPPSGKEITSTGMSIVKIERGKIVEEWNTRDDLSVMTQLGIVQQS